VLNLQDKVCHLRSVILVVILVTDDLAFAFGRRAAALCRRAALRRRGGCCAGCLRVRRIVIVPFDPEGHAFSFEVGVDGLGTTPAHKL